MTERALRILHLIDSLPREGAETVMFDLVRRSDPSLFRFSVCALTRGGELAGELKKLGVEVRILGRRHRWDAARFRDLLGLIRAGRIDLIHTHLFSSHVWGRAAGRICRRPVISTEHGLSDLKNFWRRQAERFLAAGTEKIVAVSAPVAESLISRCKIPPGRVTVIENGVNLEGLPASVSRPEICRRLGIPARAKLVGMTARLAPLKGHEYFIEAARRILARRSDVYFLLLGEGPSRGEVESLIRRHGLGRRVFAVGFRRDVLEVVAVLDVFVLSSLREGLSLALLEAMALGRPVAATAVGGAVGLIRDGVDGILVPPADAASLAGAVKRLLDDPVRAGLMGEEAGKRIRERFDFTATLAAYRELYLAAAGKNFPVFAASDRIEGSWKNERGTTD